MRLAAWLLCAVALAGCGGTLHWRKAGATQQEFARDSWECARQTATTERRAGVGGYGGFYNERTTVSKELYRACLETYGYQRVEGGEFVGLRD